MRNIIFLISFSIFLGCNNPIENTEELLIVNSHQCKLKGIVRENSIDNLLGNWVDTLFWKQDSNDSCWIGYDRLNRSIELNIQPNKIFTWKENNISKNSNFTRFGEYFFRDSLKTTIILGFNDNKDSLHHQGDTVIGLRFKIAWVDTNRILLMEPFSVRSKESYEVYDLIKKTIPNNSYKIYPRYIAKKCFGYIS